jgi:hypothetical protein
MTALAAVIPLRASLARKFCPGYEGEGCSTQIPGTSERCYFHDRPPAQRTNVPLWERRLEHLRSHLRVQDQPYLELLIEPLTIAEIAERMGPGYTSSAVNHAWQVIADSLGLNRSGGRTPVVDRLALLRIVSGMDRCFCERAA